MSITVEGHAHPVDGAWMVTTAKMDDNRNVSCVIHLTATYKFAAFHAVVRLEYVSQTGHLLGMSQQWEADCGPAPLTSAAHLNDAFFDTAPEGTHEIRLVQLAQYKPDFSNIIGIIALVLEAVGLTAGVTPVRLPTLPGNPRDTQVVPPDWNSFPQLKGLVEVTSGSLQ